MREIILNFGQQFQAGFQSASNFRLQRALNEVIVMGMGGSGLPGKILKMFAPAIKLHSSYDLPEHQGSPFVICVSWSGNTEETLSSYKKSRTLGLETLAITKGGKLGQLAQDGGQQALILPQDDIPPRFAFGYMLGALFGVLGLESEAEIKPEEHEELGKEIAQKIMDKIPLFYSLDDQRSIGYFWKVLFNENAKVPAFCNRFPELVHNEIAGFDQKHNANFLPIMIWDENNTDSHQKRNVATALAFFNELGYNSTNVNLSGKTLLEKVLNNYTLALWASCYLAQYLNVEAQDTTRIELFKKLKNS